MADDKLTVRLRSAKYLATIRKHPCLVCGGGAEAHHLTYAQPRAMSKKTGDQHTVPLCRVHHMQLHHSAMPERTWWALNGIDPVVWSKQFFERWKRENPV